MKRGVGSFVAGMLVWAIFGGFIWNLIGLLVVVLFAIFIVGSLYIVGQSRQEGGVEQQAQAREVGIVYPWERRS